MPSTPEPIGIGARHGPRMEKMKDGNASPGFSLRRAAPLLVLAVAGLAGFWLFGDLLRFDTLRENRAELIAWRDANLVLAAVLYCAVYIGVVSLSLPGATVMTLSGGFLFGAPGGTVLTVIGATIGAMVIFLAARHGFGAALHARLRAGSAGGAMARIERGLAENQWSFLLLIRLVPLVPFFVANLAPAFLGVRTRIFLVTTFFGIMPATFVYASIGAGLGVVFARGESPDLGVLTDWRVVGPLLALAALAALPIVLKLWFGRGRGG